MQQGVGAELEIDGSGNNVPDDEDNEALLEIEGDTLEKSVEERLLACEPNEDETIGEPLSG